MLIHHNGTDREMTETEIAEHEAFVVEAGAYGEKLAALEATKVSARQKLAALGLTDAEVNALIP
jgi:hypothetical protein